MLRRTRHFQVKLALNEYNVFIYIELKTEDEEFFTKFLYAVLQYSERQASALCSKDVNKHYV